MKEVYCKVNETPKRIPDTTQAEKWLNDETFTFEGRIYKVLLDGKVVLVKKENYADTWNVTE